MKKFKLSRSVNISARDLTWRTVDNLTWLTVRHLAWKSVRDSIDVNTWNSIRNFVLNNVQKANLEKV
jgi:hypothetical protein